MFESYEIIEHVATLSTKGSVSKELNLISYNGKPAKYDLRTWKTGEDGERLMMKGLTLTTEEVQALYCAIGSKNN